MDLWYSISTHLMLTEAHSLVDSQGIAHREWYSLMSSLFISLSDWLSMALHLKDIKKNLCVIFPTLSVIKKFYHFLTKIYISLFPCFVFTEVKFTYIKIHQIHSFSSVWFKSFHRHSGCPNLTSCGYRTEFCISLLAVNWGLFSASKDSSYFSVHALFLLLLSQQWGIESFQCFHSSWPPLLPHLPSPHHLLHLFDCLFCLPLLFSRICMIKSYPDNLSFLDQLVSNFNMGNDLSQQHLHSCLNRVSLLYF